MSKDNKHTQGSPGDFEDKIDSAMAGLEADLDEEFHGADFYDEDDQESDFDSWEAETRDTRPKKQIPLRLSAKLYDQIAAWAEDDFRSVNGQIEYLLTECVRQRKKNGKYVSDTMDKPPELDIS